MTATEITLAGLKQPFSFCSEERARNASDRARRSEYRAMGAEAASKRADRAEKESLARAVRAEQERDETIERANVAQKQAHQQTTDAERRAEDAELRARAAEQGATDCEVIVRDAERRIIDVEASCRAIEQRAYERVRAAEERVLAIERRHNQFWLVGREEVEFTQEELGRGGWAVVKVAKFRGLRVAAKCLHNVIISDYNCQLFNREMTIAARLRHPNLIQFMGAVTGREPIILMELMTTGLRAVLEQQQLTARQSASISLDVAKGLSFLHLTKPDAIIHRDVSSANVLLDPGPNNIWKAKVSDYGSANFLRQLGTVGPGNPSYAAPEASHPSQQSPKMDVYSYGVLLLEMYSRRFPGSEDQSALLLKMQPSPLVGLITQCLEQQPEKRPVMNVVVE